MSKIPEMRRIVAEEFPEQRDWIGKLIAPVNLFMEQVQINLSRGLTFQDNISCRFIEHTDYGAYPVDIAWNLRSKPAGAWIVYARELSGNHVNFTNAPYLDWEFTSNGSFRINAIPNLSSSASNPFLVKIIAITG